ncbi:Subtilisin E precursor [Crateriforma conspicua]|uniref:Subtilisin E n=1 Tax=Crateriforma conspicua TaxID=2527996 RepID=A0A5C6FLS4_9PLAN|nr:S8 family serine peptidase [Crateriforma conspicua]TWU62997.1 Subtilisin E precursor [Crateriforma conspicua]
MTRKSQTPSRRLPLALLPTTDGIRQCETRLAFSASLAAAATADLLQDGLGSHDVSDVPLPMDSSGTLSPASDHSLLDQAADLRDTYGLTGDGQTIAVIDSGIAWDHEAFTSPGQGVGIGPGYRVVGGWDFAEDDADPYDDGPAGYHGTHVAGLLAGQSSELSGMAPEADLVALRVFDDSGEGSLEWIESALRWVHDSQNDFEHPITTVNLSIGAALNDANRDYAIGILEDELQLLHDDGILVFAAAGNYYANDEITPGTTDLLYPASSPNVIAVTSIDDGGQISDFAQRESGILAAPGEGQGSAVPDHVFGWDGTVDDYAALSGTSMATPQVAAATVLIREAMIASGLEPTADDVLQRLRDHASEHQDAETGLTYYSIDLQSALDGLQPSGGSNQADDGGEGETAVSASQVTTDHQSQQFTLDLRDGMSLNVRYHDGSEQAYLLTDQDGQIFLDAAGGSDRLEILGSVGSERLRLSADPNSDVESRLIAGGVEIVLRGFEDVQFDGGGGSDRATLYDSSGDDLLESRSGDAVLSGVGFRFDVRDVVRTYVHATAGGNDAAYLYDSDGDDTLVVQPGFTSLRGTDSSGASLFQSAYGFESVSAYATAGGHDTAELYDSVGDDVLSISPTRSMVSSGGYQVSARYFENVTAESASGGTDIAKIYSNESESQWHVAAGLTQWTSVDGATRIARGFDRVDAFENFQPVSLPLGFTPQAAPVPLDVSDQDDERFEDATRRVFEQLGF